MNANNANTTPAVPAENTAPPDANFDMATDSQRFTETVIKEYSISTAQDGILQVTDSQRILIQGYFLVIDRALKTSEERSPRDNNSDDGFDEFWKAYPRKEKKPYALKVWKKLKPDRETLAAILEAIERRKQLEQWRKDNGQYIPHPVLFFKTAYCPRAAPIRCIRCGVCPST